MSLATYRFGGTLSISEFTVSRVKSEREREEVYRDFAHHSHPMRGIFDVIHFETFVFVNKSLTKAEEAAFLEAMNHTLSEFRRRFESKLRDMRISEGDKAEPVTTDSGS